VACAKRAGAAGVLLKGSCRPRARLSGSGTASRGAGPTDAQASRLTSDVRREAAAASKSRVGDCPRYRYYVSQALLQGRKQEAGSIARVSAPEIEEAILQVLRERDAKHQESGDGDLINRCIRQIVIKPDRLSVDLLEEEPEHLGPSDSGGIEIPFRSNASFRKGVAHEPSSKGRFDEHERDALLRAIAKAHRWVEAIVSGQAPSFEAIASREKLGVRHVRRLAPLAYLAPRVIDAIVDGSAPSGLTVSALTMVLPHSWSAQERMIGLA
jgi:site-specific DNA recombinase